MTIINRTQCLQHSVICSSIRCADGFVHAVIRECGTNVLGVILQISFQLFRACIECLGFKTGPLSKNCSQQCKHIEDEMVDKLSKQDKKPCKEKDSQNCFMIFSMTELDGVDKYKASILKDRGQFAPWTAYTHFGGDILVNTNCEV